MSEETSTETPLLVSVGSLRNAVWMPFFTWSELSVAPVVEPLCPAGEPTAELEPVELLCPLWSLEDDDGDALGLLDCELGAWLLLSLLVALPDWLVACSPMKLVRMKLLCGGVEGAAFGFVAVGGFSSIVPLGGFVPVVLLLPAGAPTLGELAGLAVLAI